MSIFVEQVKVLVKKDFWILKSHKKAICAELVLPLLIAAVTGLLVHEGAEMMGQKLELESKVEFYNRSHYAKGYISPPTLLSNSALLSDKMWFTHPCQDEESCLQQYWNWSSKPGNNWQTAVGIFGDPGTRVNPRWFNATGEKGIPSDYSIQFQINDQFYGGGSLRDWAPTLYHLYNPWTTTPMKGTTFQLNNLNAHQLLGSIATLLISFAFFPLISSTGGRLTDEKRNKVREHLRVMGVKSSAYLLSVFGSGFIRVTFVALLITVVFTACHHGGPSINSLTLLAVLILYGVSLVAFSLLMPCLFSRSSFATGLCSLFLSIGTVGGIFSTLLPAPAQYALAFFFSPVAYTYVAGQVLGNYSVSLPVTPITAAAFLLWQVVFYSLLSQYLYALFPGEYGVSQSAMFPCYYLKRMFSKKDCGDDLSTPMMSPKSQKDAIHLDRLVKYYGSQRDVAAVDGLSLSIHRGEIFALLGHNGAGKTTTISMLTGMLEATSYTEASLDGLDLVKDIDLIRNRIGTCPQFDVLFDDLSATQHVEIFSRIKGVTAEKGLDVMNRLSLPTDAQKASTFSGGMKRRLSVTCALAGGSNIIFLDEPSSGLDPVSRRELWDMLKTERDNGRTIILTTHFMEEADYLGNRIGIMSHGRMYCCDTSSALKQQYGVGYYLTLAKNVTNHHEAQPQSSSTPTGQVEFNTEAALNLCLKFCPGSTLHHESMGDAVFLLPSDQLPNYGNLLAALDDKLPSLGATSYGIRMNSLEDVFVTVSEKESDKEDPLDMSSLNTTTLSDGRLVEEEMAASAFDNGCVRRFFSQVGTVMLKKWMFLGRSKRMWFLGIVIPMVLVVVGYATVIQISGGSGYITESTDYPNLNEWVVPTAGPLTPKQRQMLSIAEAQYDVLAKRFFQNVSDAYDPDEPWTLKFAEYTVEEMVTGQYIDHHSIAFSSLTSRIAVGLAFQDYSRAASAMWKTQGMYDVPLDIARGIEIDTLDVCVSSSYKFTGGVGMFMYQLLTYSRQLVELNGTSSDVRTPVWPNISFSFMPPPPVPDSTPAPASSPGSQSSSSASDDGDENEVTLILIPLGVFLVILIAQYAGNATLQVADEITRRVFQTLRMHGLSAAAYWTGTILFDTLVALFVVLAYVVGAYVRDVKQMESAFLLYTSIMIIGFVINTLLFSYALVTVLPALKPSTYVTAIFGFELVLMVIPIILSLAICRSADVSKSTSNVIAMVFMTPPKALFSAFINSPSTFLNPHKYRTSSLLGNGYDVDMVAFFSVWYWSLLPIFVLYRYSTAPTRGKRTEMVSVDGGATGEAVSLLSAVVQQNSAMDQDVRAECQRVEAGGASDMVSSLHLRQDYNGKKLAVKDVTFGVRTGECFGLLGPNGAGKTTTVKMMLQELAPSGGSANFPYTDLTGRRGLDSTYERLRLGVCQQHDTLWETFNDREHMELYLRIRLAQRYKKELWKDYITDAISKVYLDAEGKRSEAYSGGMKRKLSVCIALYTGAQAVFLDEPSTGMDPYARRAMWKSINEALQQDRCVLLTTHSMEEADAVCSRIAIIAGGEMQCIGNGQHLKNRFGTGYSITLLLKTAATDSSQRPNASDDRNATTTTTNSTYGGVGGQDEHEARLTLLDSKMKTMFGSECERTEAIGSTIRYGVGAHLSTAKAFQQLADVSSEWGLESYSVNQVSSLEQIFVGFAQKEEDEEAAKALTQKK